ncbi:Mitochondrial carrier protein PET8 [Ophiocordyceps sinensis CO18]|nr:Mitochondrial carrier protein PET8 [Ophiocordyceps sinensis CO18]
MTIATAAARVAAASRAGLVGRGVALSTSARLGLKESSSQTDVDYEKHKQDSLNKQRKGSGHWKPELASDSEEAVKADRAGHDGDVASLQEKTKRVAEESSKAGTSVRDGM